MEAMVDRRASDVRRRREDTVRLVQRSQRNNCMENRRLRQARSDRQSLPGQQPRIPGQLVDCLHAEVVESIALGSGHLEQ